MVRFRNPRSFGAFLAFSSECIRNNNELFGQVERALEAQMSAH